MNKTIIICAALCFFISTQLMAKEPVKIGMVTTLSTKAGYLGEEMRDGFKLAIDQENGMLGGVPVELLVEDSGRKPEKAKQIADRYIKKDGVKILTGIIFSNVAMAVVPKVVREDVIYLARMLVLLNLPARDVIKTISAFPTRMTISMRLLVNMSMMQVIKMYI